MDDRSTTINIGGTDYTMVFTTRAIKEIAKRYGGLDSLGDKLLNSTAVDDSIEEVAWLLTLLCNQGIQIHNLKNPDDKKPLLSLDEVELLTTPADLGDYKDAIFEALNKGAGRNIQSEEQKNTVAG